MSDTDPQSPALAPPPPIRVPSPGDAPDAEASGDAFPGEVEMTLLEHLDELRNRILRSLLAVVVAAAGCLVVVRPLVRLLEAPAEGIRFLQLAPGEFLFVSIKVAGYAGLSLALPYVLYEILAFVLPASPAGNGSWWRRPWPARRCSSWRGWPSPGGPWCPLPCASW